MSKCAGRAGLGCSSPPQLGQVPSSGPVAQAVQNVHSKEQIMACRESGGRGSEQRSQAGLSSSTAAAGCQLGL